MCNAQKFLTFETYKFLSGKRRIPEEFKLWKMKNSIKSKERPHMYAFKLINSKIEIVLKVSKGVF